jgi:hypothetical protein
MYSIKELNKFYKKDYEGRYKIIFYVIVFLYYTFAIKIKVSKLFLGKNKEGELIYYDQPKEHINLWNPISWLLLLIGGIITGINSIVKEIKIN